MREVVIERSGAVLVCRLNRPQDRNGLTGALLAEYLAALEEARTDAGVRVVVTTGEGDAFSAGADMSDLDGESARQGLNVLMHDKLGLTGTLSTADRAFDRLGIGRETLAIKNFDKPLIAAVNGAAAGGGFALAMLHDIRLASATTRSSLNWNWSGHTKSPPLIRTTRGKVPRRSASGVRRGSADVRRPVVRP